MKKLILTILLIALSVTVSDSRASALSPEEQVQWLIKTFGELPPEHHLTLEARKVFERVRATADKRADRDPRLLLIRAADEPWAICLKDGTIVLTEKSLEFCYKDADKAVGDSRTAFVMGHEMAHLSKDDFWEWDALQTVRSFGNETRAVQELIKVLAGSDDSEKIRRARNIRMRKELQADSYGLMYATMAGYDPRAIANAGGKNFLKEWADQITGKAAFGGTHPDPDMRAAFLLSCMNSVSDVLDLFHIGVRLYQVGNYPDALDFLETFRRVFPSREVLNNIGLCHYQLALMTLDKYDRAKLRRCKLSTIVDIKTLAGVFRGKDEVKGIFEKEMQKAIECFRKACEKDPFYGPARLNLSAAHIMSDQYVEALSPLKDALKLRQDDPGALNNQAVAMYCFQSGHGVDFSGQTVTALKNIIKDHPGFSDPWYNLGRVLDDRKDIAAARKAWSKYLELEPVGDYAAVARKTLGQPPAEPAVSEKFREPPFVQLNTFYKKIKDRLTGLAERSLEVSNLSASYFSGDGLQILVLGGVVKLVESPVRKKMRLSELGIGPPRRILPHSSGAEIFVYKRFALEVRNGVAEKVVHF